MELNKRALRALFVREVEVEETPRPSQLVGAADEVPDEE